MTTVKLTKPIENGSETITELVFREMVAGDLRGINSSDQFGSMLDLAGKLCAQPTNVINKLGVKDTAAVVKVVSSFLADFQEIGASL